ncbi:LCP family protein [bacterium]|nr:LCP family protein [bacterium]
MRRGTGLVDVTLCLFAAVLAVAGTLGVRDALGKAPVAEPGQMPYLLTPPSIAPGIGGPISVLLIGADDRKDRGRSDTLIVAYVNPKVGRAALLSIPRDTRVEIPGHTRTKINHAYRFGGVPLVRQTVEGLLGESLPRYAKLDFETFKRVVDVLGGVTLKVEDVEGHGRGMNYDDNWDGLHIHLKPGTQKLNGEKAMGFVRYRRDGDLQRGARQRQFLRAMVEQHVRASNMFRLIRAARVITSRMDTNLPTAEAVRLAVTLRRISPDRIMTAALPVKPAPSHGVYYSEVEESQAQALREQMRQFVAGQTQVAAGGDELSAPVNRARAERPEAELKACRVAILNGTGTPGIGKSAGEQLRRGGAVVTSTGNAQKFDYLRTEIRYHVGTRQAAEEVKGLLGTPFAAVEEDDKFDAPGAASIMVTLGKDFRPH